jgi:acyl-CoA reductase-like NAD-dependent aldehyde dehydrogenase
MHSVKEVQKMSVVAPATGKVIAEIEETPVQEVPFFYQKAKDGFSYWSSLAAKERTGYLRKLKQLMVDEMDQIAKVISEDTGKVLTESIVADIMPTLDAIDHIIKHAEKVLARKKVKTPLLLFGKKSFIEYMPRGVVLVISPWNYPLQLAMVPMISALAGGNSVILKPSEVTPLVGECIEDLFKRSGFPEGTVQVAHGGKEVGAAFTAGKPDYIFFTGSVRTGKIIQQQAAKDLIPTTLELGGKDPMIVFEDANIDRAVKAAAWGAFTNSGQVCMSAERLYVERSIYGNFLEKLKNEVNSLQQGSDINADVGSMTFPGQIDVVKAQLDEAIERGAKLETGLKPSDWKGDMFLPLTVVTGVEQDMKIIQEESFGPLLPVVPFDTEEEAIAFANGTVFGLNASVWTNDKAKARRVASRLVSGAVVINDVLITVANHGLPFGGTKESGIGRYHSEAGLRIFCHEKAIMEDLGFMKSEIQWYPYKGKYPLFLNLFKSYFSEERDWFTFVKNYIALLKSNK